MHSPPQEGASCRGISALGSKCKPEVTMEESHSCLIILEGAERHCRLQRWANEVPNIIRNRKLNTVMTWQFTGTIDRFTTLSEARSYNYFVWPNVCASELTRKQRRPKTEINSG